MAETGITLRIKADGKQASTALGQTAKAMADLRQKVDAAQIGMGKLSVAIVGAQAAFAALAASVKGVFSDMPRSLLGAAVQAERMQTAFRVLTGSLEAARAEIAFVRREAYRLGIPLAEASDAWLMLAAAARGTALEGEAARRIFSAVSGAAATIGLSAEKTSGALLAISQMMSKGTVQAEELRNQLGERLPGAFQIAARAMGVKTERLSEMLDRGEIVADVFLPRFAEQLAKEIPAASDTTQQALNRLSSATEEWRRHTGSALVVAIDGMLGLKEAAGRLGQDDRVMEWARKSAKAIAIMMDVVRELALLVPNVLKTIGGSIAAVARDLKLAFDIAAAAVTEGIGEKGRAAMKRALQERNAFIAAYNEDMVKRWFPKQLSERVDDFFRQMRANTASAASKAAAVMPAGAGKPKPAKTGNLDAARLAAARDMADAELTLLKDGLRRQKDALEAALQDRLVSIRAYHAEKTRLEQAEIDAGIRRTQALLAEQQRVARNAGTEAERIRARGEVAKLEAELITLNNRRADVEIANARAAAAAERELADALAAAREELAQITGAATDADRRAAIERSYRDLRARLAAENDTAGVSLIDRLIDVKAAQANLDALEAAWMRAQERMRQAQEAARIAFDAGLITQDEYQKRVAQSSQEAAAALDALIPKMQAAAAAIGPDAALRVEGLKNRLAELGQVIDPVAQAIDTDIKNAFVGMFQSIGNGAKSAKDAFLDFARSVIASIQRIAAQKLAEQIFGAFGKGGGLGAIFSRFVKGFAGGGYVRGPGTSTSDSIPARLSAGEYVIRAAAVRRVGVAFLDAINGLRAAPAWDGRRYAFAAGGLAPAAQQQAAHTQAVRIVNVVDPAMVANWAESSAGERTILNVIGRNPSRVRQMLGG